MKKAEGIAVPSEPYFQSKLPVTCHTEISVATHLPGKSVDIGCLNPWGKQALF